MIKKTKKTYYKIVPKIYRTDEYKDGNIILYEVDEKDHIITLFLEAGNKIRYLQEHCTGFKTLKEVI